MEIRKTKKIKFPRVGEVRTLKGFNSKSDIKLTIPLMRAITKEGRRRNYKYKYTPISTKLKRLWNRILSIFQK